MLLDRVLEEIGTESGPAEFGELSRRLGVQASALEGMLSLLARKGLIARPRHRTGDEPAACTTTCGATCTGVDACPFILRTEG
jgi:DNA-binding HxlR family transcriptional regulator